MSGAKSGGKIHYAWFVSGAGFVSQIMTVLGVAGIGMSLTYVADGLGVSVGDAGIISSAFGITFGFFSFVWGWLSDRIGLRKSLSIASLIVGIFFILFGLVTNNILVGCLLYAIVGFAVSGLSSGVMPKLLATWFDSSVRGRGSIIMSFGGTVAGFLIGLIGPQLLLAFDWRGYFVAFGAFCIVLTVIIFAVMRDKPSDLGLLPCGAKSAEDVSFDPPQEKGAIGKVVKMSITWKQGVMQVLYAMWMGINNTYLVSVIIGCGYDIVVAGLVSSINTIGMCVSQIFWPTMSDKISRKRTLMIMLFGCGVVYVALFFLAGLGAAMVYALIACLGFFAGSTPVNQTMLAECYPPSLRGTGPGVCMAFSVVGQVCAPILGGFIMNTMDAKYVFVACAIFTIAAGLVAVLLPLTGGKYGDPLAENLQTPNAFGDEVVAEAM